MGLRAQSRHLAAPQRRWEGNGAQCWAGDWFLSLFLRHLLEAGGHVGFPKQALLAHEDAAQLLDDFLSFSQGN